MHVSSYSAVATIGLFVFMLCGLEVGHRFGLRRLAKDPEGSHKGTGAVEGAVFGLLGLLMALTFTGAATRFDMRREQIVNESTSLCTAFQRLDLVQPEEQEELRASYRRYVDLRVELFATEHPDFKAHGVKEKAAKDELWKLARVAVAKKGCENTGSLVLSGLNDVFEKSNRRKNSARMHVPEVILFLLFGLAAFSSVLAGYAMATSPTRKMLHMLAFATILSVTIYVILDLEYPRSGIINMDEMDATLSKARETME